VGALGAAAGANTLLIRPGASEAAIKEAERTEQDENTLTYWVWTFVDVYTKMAAAYRQHVNPKFKLVLREFPFAALTQKALTALETGVGGPDLIDIEQGEFGAYLHGTVPLVSVDQRLATAGLLDKIVPSRLALYRWKGRVYGIERSLAPVIFYYRADIFAKYGIKPASLKTWDDFIAAGKKLAAAGIYMHPSSYDFFELLLRQRGGDLFNAKGEITADSPLAVDTLQWIIDLNTKLKIAKPPAGLGLFAPQFFAEMQKGVYASIMGADWYGLALITNVTNLSGKWRAMPLPVWADDPAKRRASCWGGTALSIPLTTKKSDLAFSFASFLALSVPGAVTYYKITQQWPVFEPAWKDPQMHIPWPYYGGQDLGAVFAEVGPEVPPEYQSPFRADFNNFAGADAAQVTLAKTSAAAFLKQEVARVRAKMKQEGAA
jgi:ABC-type glycerol-3-phosphate transport system substrate-binding protein